jgi:type II secretory pathway pseudopilin PulG
MMAQPTMTGSGCQRGFAYMALLVVIAISLLTLTIALPDKFQQAQRDKEAQFFFAGQQYQLAIKHFYENRFVTVKRYPKTIKELLEDKRGLKVQHHLRQAYTDPMMPSGEWGLIKNEQDEIMGVYSLSLEPLITTHFDSASIVIGQTQGPLRYNDLKFVYSPNLLTPITGE